ncbi:carbohydrate ABC transporter permease [Thermoanaerobacterium aotearoense]|uniref:ABC transporter n=3 Tax=Thermoanaerobacterium TaxID=28895 RepID=W9EBY7_9THEO|nr:sugar ABC transporter permease [Thermoanaerobacterium aotearoense]AFK85186.1 ABC-type transporter, integral membrane subunit [Thermoanaerobacterium saccharolyticum JW/SL-YS485]ETO39638.1 ABC transporter [Thermoanaerobacterium aotearoense SCUT27]
MIPIINKSKFKIDSNNAPYFFIMPIIILFLVFMVYPIIYSLILSFQKFDNGKYIFAGLENYRMLFKDDVFIQGLENTFIYLIIQVPIMILLALILATLLNNKFIKFKQFFRISFFLPALIGLVAYSIVFKLFLNTDFGFINYLLKLFHLPIVDWLNGQYSSKASVIIAITWRWTGYNMVILLAALQGIPDDIYEACDIDGANAIQKFLFVTVPLVKPVILFCTITSTIGTLQLFDEPYILTGGGPSNATITVAQYLYNTGFRYFNFGYAAAISYVIAIIIAILSYIQFKVVGSE